MVQINQEIKPTHPDGWHFWDDGIRITGKSYKDLVVKATEYRISCRKPWDGLVEEINEYLVSISPDTRGPDLKSYQKPEVTHSDKVYNWLSRTYDSVNSSTRYASAPEASRRCSVCANCPYNVIPESNCGLCESQMRRMAKGIAKNRSVGGQKSLRSCLLLNYDLAVAIHLEADTLGERESDPRLPPSCWRK